MASNSGSNVTCTSFPDHPNDCVTINTIRRVFGALSCLGCIFVIFIIWVFNRYTSLAQRLVLYLSIAALLNGIGRLFQDSTSEHGGWCSFQAFWLTLFNWAVMLWVGCITVNLYVIVIWSRTIENFERRFNVVCWGISIFVSLLPFITHKYGPSGSWCWISDFGVQLAIWYVPLFLFIVINSAVYIYIVVKLYRQATTWTGTYDPENERTQQLLKKDIKSLRLYPLVYAVLSIFPLINRIQNATSDHHVFGLVLLHAMSATMQGVVYSIIFAVDRDTLRSLTPAQIKAAILSKRAPPIVVQEYAVDVTTPDEIPTVFENPMASATGDNSAANADNSVSNTDNPLPKSDNPASGSSSSLSFVPSADTVAQSQESTMIVLERECAQNGEKNEVEDSSTA